MSDDNKNPAVKAANEMASGIPADGIITLSTGVKAKIVPVAANLIQKVRNQIKPPTVPMWFNEDKGREEPNPNDPGYLRELADLEQKRGAAVVDALILFGVELLDEMPQDKSWLKRLQLVGIEVDENDPFDVEFAYKNYVAVSSEDLITITQAAGLQTEAIESRLNSFRDKEK